MFMSVNNIQIKRYLMEEIESYDVTLMIKELRLSVKFPCRLTLQHSGRPVSPEVPSNNSSVFNINRDVSIKEDKNKDYLQINVNLTTDKGGNIMAGIIKINLKDISSSEGQSLTISLQKCLDPYATCLLTVKSVKLNRSRLKKSAVGEEWKKNTSQGRFESRSEAPVLNIQGFKHRPRYNEAEAFGSKKIVNTLNSPMNSQLKDKALSMAGFRAVNTSFDRDQLASRFKHFGRKDEDSKTVITGKWKESDQAVKASVQASEKTLKLQILKYKTKFEESERNIDDKSKQIKNLKEQISDMSRQLTEKQYLIEQLTAKNNQISKLQQANKGLSRQLHQERNKIIDLQREMNEQKNNSYTNMSRYKQENDKKEHELQKSIYEKRQEIKEVMEENHYKNNQINKMKNLIEDLESNLETKTYEYEKMYSREKNEHNKTKTVLQQKINDLMAELQKNQQALQEASTSLKKGEEENAKLDKKITYLEDSLLDSEQKMEDETRAKEKALEEKKRLEKVEEELNLKIKNLQRQLTAKEKEIENSSIQYEDYSLSSKKKISQLMEKNKNLSMKVQELENKVNLMTAQEEKLKRTLEMSQKEVKGLQENQKMLNKNSKLKDERILQLQKDVTEMQNKNSMKDNLSKKELQYKTIQFQKLSARVSDLEKTYEKEKETSEERRLDLLKTENKVRMLEQGTNRLNDQIKEIKIAHIKKEDEWLEKMKELKEELKTYEAKEAENNKQLHNSQIEKINLKNEMSKLEKSVEIQAEKIQKQKKRQNELQTTIKALKADIQSKSEEILNLQTTYKDLQNDLKTLQADKSKTEKISTIINQEKVNAVSDISKLKKQIQKKDQKQQAYLGQIKQLKEDIVKLELRLNTSSKQYQKFKANVSESIKNSFSNKSSSYASLETGLDLSRGVNRSRTKPFVDYSFSVDTNELKFSEAIQNYARQSQQMLMTLSEQMRKVKKDKENLEKDLSSLNIRFRDAQEEYEKKVTQLSAEIETITSHNSLDIEEYEDKVFHLEKQLKKRQKSINDLVTEIQQLKVIQNNQFTSHQIAVAELISKINSLKGKITDHQIKDQSNTLMFVNLEEKLTVLEAENTELLRQNGVLTEQLNKKEKECLKTTEELEELIQENQGVKKAKSDLLGELLSTKESLTVEKESNKHLLVEIKEEETKNTQLRVFNAQLLKEKESSIKKEAQLTQKVNGFEQKVQMLMIDIAQKSEELIKREKNINQQREEIKTLRIENSNLQSSISDLKLDLEREKEKVKDRERKLSEKDEEIEQLNNQEKKNTLKLEAQISKLNQDVQELTENLRKEKSQSSIKYHEFELQIKTLKESQKKINQANIGLEEQIFFEKQMNSLNSTKIDELNHQITNLHIEQDKLNTAIGGLNDELREKEESLFALSGKLFTSENKLESKQDELRSRLEKQDLDWRYKVEEICEEYENKLDMMEREKSYVRNGMEGCSEAVQKLENEKASLKQQLEKQRESWEARLKKAEEEKLISLIQKNRQIEKIREVFEDLEEKLKIKDLEIKTIDEEKKKVEDKIRDLRAQMEKNEEKKTQTIHVLEREVDQLKRKEGQLKRFKEALKNNQWAIQREIKKSIQLCAKSIINLTTEENKEEVMTLMRNLQISVSKMALPNIDQI